MPIGHDGPNDVEVEREFEGLAEQLVASHALASLGLHELSPRLIPQAATVRATVNAPMRTLWDEHRPFMDVDAMGPEPIAELLRLRKQVVPDQLAFQPGKGWKKTVAISEVEGHPGTRVFSKTRAPPIPMRARTAEEGAIPSCQLRTMLQGDACQSFWLHVLAAEHAAQTFVACEYNALIDTWGLA